VKAVNFPSTLKTIDQPNGSFNAKCCPSCYCDIVLFSLQTDNKTFTRQIQHDATEDKGRPRQNWVSCVAVDPGQEGVVYAGDSHGQMTKLEKWQVAHTKKVV